MSEEIIEVTRHDTRAQMALLWDALESYRETCINNSLFDSEWDDICSSMAWIEEDLNALRGV